MTLEAEKSWMKNPIFSRFGRRSVNVPTLGDSAPSENSKKIQGSLRVGEKG